MKELGLYLKSAREKQKRDLEDVATRTKIHIYKLEAIEEGRQEDLPAKVFCVGLVKSYARELKADMTVVDRLLQEAFASTEESPAESSEDSKALPEDTVTEENGLTSLLIANIPYFLGGLFVLALLIFMLTEVADKMNSYSQEKALPKEVRVSPRVEDSVDETIKKAEKESSPDAEAKAKAVEKTAKPEAEPMNGEPEPVAAVAVTSPPPTEQEPEGDPAEDLFEEEAEGPSASNSQTTQQPPSHKLSISALEPVRIEIVWSDGFVQVMLLKSQETKTLVFSQSITVRINNGGAAQVALDNQPPQIPGSLNEPIELDFP
jgi:cytoskeleton protein RodZ